jgi:hypothetical protein
MKRLAKLLVTLPFIYCLQLPDLGSLNHLLQTASAENQRISNERITAEPDGSYALFFNSPIESTFIQIWLNTNQPDASFCPEN